MLRLTLRQVRADGLRLLLSSLAIVLGVAFVAGTLMFTDGMRAGAYERAGEFDRHTDLAAYAETDPLPPALVDRVRALDGVAAAAGELTGSAGVVGADGRPVLGYAVLAAVPTEAALQSYDVVAGRLPQRPGEVVLDDETVAEQRFTVGGPVSIGGRDGAARPYTLVGTVDVDGSSRDVGGPYIGLTGPDALTVSGEKGYGRIMVAARPGVDTAALADRIRAVVGPDVTVRDRDAILDAAVDDAVRDLRQFGMLLGTFAAVAVVVAGFVIANTFAIVLAQRSRRTALLRLVGATRGQIYRATLSEAAVTGLLASVVGVLAGAAVAGGLGVLLAGTGAPLGGGLTLTPRTLLLSLGLGTLLTVASAALPAWHGTRVAPVAALTDAAVNPVRPAGRIRLAVGALALAAGVAALAGAGATGQVVLVAAGGLLAFGGIVAFGPVLVPALVRVLGGPFRAAFGATGGLAVSNAVRNPRRVAATATAMVIGIGLVSAFVVGAASVKSGIERAVDARIGVDFLVTGIGGDLPATVAGELAARPELGVVHEQRSRVVGDVQLRAAHPALVRRTLSAVDAGDPAGLGPGSVLVHRELAATRGWTAGSTITLAGRPFRVAAVVADEEPILAGSPVPAGHLVDVLDADFTAMFPTVRGHLAEVDPAAGVSVDEARTAVESVLARYPTVNVMDQAAYKKMLTGTVDLVLGFVTALLGLAVVISLVGVANTLSLSVVERTRETAVLRAVGLSRAGMRGVLAVEAVLTALVGTLLGIALGTGAAAGAMAVVARIGGDFTLVLPWARIGLIVAVAVVAALLASVLPARRALSRPVVASLGAD
ncbi:MULTISPECIES: ABC transporter permease [unclassified Micromonospora]|uniref:ABC transporter permease n=1 Tax=unclassified Micromonospora TaxID=2617518 RepID=UPI00112942C6|nr:MULTISPECIES: ABC transporter permease [unclassified Micromonospora]MCK1806771.1 ABC transporter permease [Micromonospora sp. R42106]MCK1832420.1 ABC transporter permease [Micromonospora sp. R42003]MCK1843782.1 ABC transporter permease [Micromonospora sp. R42004]MCM1019686.1 ABC transporter permease [Micromonospora sp. XM-20-01]